MSDPYLCPFSKPILGGWCRCPNARVSDRCAGKMVCMRAAHFRKSCEGLVDELKRQSRFVLGVSETDHMLTHAQMMKIRCGGLQGMRRVLGLSADKPPAVREVIDAADEQYGQVADFPFDRIVQDIQAFSHREKTSR